MPLEGVKSIIRKKTQRRNKNIHSEVHYWADIISSTFGERRKFAMYLGIIKRIGVKSAQKIFAEIKDSSAKSPGKLFVWKAAQKNRDNSPPPRGGVGGGERRVTP